MSQLAMLADDHEEAIAWGERAIALATRFGDERTRAHALINAGGARTQRDPDDTEDLVAAHAIADAAGDRHEATRALLNLGYYLMCWVRPEPALRNALTALAYARRHEVHTLGSYLATMVAWLRLRAGYWEEAERGARAELGRAMTIPKLLAETVLCELAVRRGDPGARESLDEIVAQGDRTGELQRVAPALELETEWALTHGAPLPAERLARVLDEIAGMDGWGALRVRAWASVAGLPVAWDGPAPEPYGAMLRRDWIAAADVFGAVGWEYDRALLLSLCDGEEPLAEAIEIARRLGAVPLRDRVARRMRRLGLAIPRGPRQATRSNPAGLTARQVEVLALVAGGLTNADIAERLVISPRTAEHHVSAVLDKLGVVTRREAARRAAELGVV
jgi:DNA-binding CsgD family transcriptional regulator